MQRRGKARITSLVEFVFDGILLLCFIAQSLVLGCLLIFGYLPLPTQWLNDKISENLPDGISISADDYRLSLDGTIRLRNISLHVDGLQKSVFTADDAYAEFTTAFGSKPLFELDHVVLTDGTLVLPAVYSPSGKDQKVLERIALRLVPSEGEFAIDSFAALHETIRLRGSLNYAAGTGKGRPVDGRAAAHKLLKQTTQLLSHKSHIEGLNQPTLFFHADVGANQAFQVSSRISSREFKNSEIQAKNLTLDTTFSLTENTLVSESSVIFKSDTLELINYPINASDLLAKVENDNWKLLLKGEWPDMEIFATDLRIEDVLLKSPRIKLSPQAFPEIGFSGLTSGLSGAVKFSGSANIKTREASIQAAGSIDLLSVTPEKIIERLPSITVNKAPYYNLSLSFKENFSLEKAELRGRIDALEVEEIIFDHIRFRGKYIDGSYSIDTLYLRRDWQWLNLGFNLNPSTHEYGVSLVGFAKPYDYNAILPRWWGGIFRDFDFEQVEDGLGDFVIYGKTNEKAADFYFGHARASNVAYQGVRVDEGELFVRGRGPYAEVYQLNARSGHGFARGDIKFTSRIDEVRGPLSVRLDLDTKLTLSDAQKLFPENIAKVLSDFEASVLPRAKLKGAIFNDAYSDYKGLSFIDLEVSCPSPLSYQDIPLDSLKFDLFGRPEIVYLRDMEIGFAEGKGTAQADILTTSEDSAKVRFIASFQDVNQQLAVETISEINQTEPASRNNQTVSDPGQIDFELHAKGPINDPLKFKGYGNFEIENDQLYNIQLFGPLSRLLHNTMLGFTSFELNNAVGDFTLDEALVLFNRLQIDGPRTKIEAPGTVNLDDLSLNMRVSVFLFGNAGNPESRIRRWSQFITRPIPNILEFELTGTPDNQTWRSLYDPRKLIPLF